MYVINMLTISNIQYNINIFIYFELTKIKFWITLAIVKNYNRYKEFITI